jgi:16S rRNA (uracil1498-N3)-methyltransferase
MMNRDPNLSIAVDIRFSAAYRKALTCATFPKNSDICGMEVFFAYEADGRFCRLDADESGHCCRVLRHRAGDEIHVIDGLGTMFRCRLVDDNPKGAEAEVLEAFPGWGGHPYRLSVACCPTKNNDRFEWFVEKATEVGVDRIIPVIGDRSERKVYKTDRAARIALSATKQSLKARIPEIVEPLSVKDFIKNEEILRQAQNDGEYGHSEPVRQEKESLKLIAYCFEGDTKRISIQEALKAYDGNDITVLIGPEGDFSPEEARLAVDRGYIPVHLGASRLRTETAAVIAATAVYLRYE